MAAEMAEQPRVLAGLVARADELRAVVGRVGPRQLTGVTLVARGSSACAALFGRYVLEVATGRPVSEAAPSLHTLYNTRVDYSGQLVVAMSQSGETPEIVAVTERLAAAGASTIAITNGVDSPLAQVATGVFALDAGIERSVPATKTVTAELLALALLASALGLVGFAAGDVQSLPDTVESLLSDTGGSADLARSLRHAESLLVVARGYLLPAALELALKLEETCRPGRGRLLGRGAAPRPHRIDRSGDSSPGHVGPGAGGGRRRIAPGGARRAWRPDVQGRRER